jgi:4-azaleucine resistance transporter AzlC
MNMQQVSTLKELEEKQVVFTRKGLLRGMRRTIPLAISGFTVGLVFGVLARQAGLNTLEVFLMSALVFAGASQFIALSLWVLVPFPALTIIFTTLIVNLRHMLMGASLRPWLSQFSRAKVLALLYLMVDESWALTIGDFTEGGRDMAFLLGSGLVMLFAWVSSSVIGHIAGSAITNPAQWGLDFAFTAVFLALLTGMWKGKSNLLPWAVAAVVAVISYRLLPGAWYIVLGGLAGSVTGAISNAK